MADKSRRLTLLILALPRPLKRAIALGLDAVLCAISVYLAFYLRLGVFVDPLIGPPHPTMGAIAIALPIFVSMGLYRAIFRHAGFGAVEAVARACALYALPYALIYSVVGVYGVPRTIGLIQPILLFLLVAASRLLVRAYLGEAYKALWNSGDLPRVLIYGAGRAGRQLAGAIRSSGEMRLAGFVDDDEDLWHSTINDTRVYAPDQLAQLVRKRAVTDVLLAIPSASRTRRAEIVELLKPLALHVRTLPAVVDLARGKVSVSDVKDLEIDDLLGRQPVAPDPALLARNITGKTVLVTGAGGSIGSELCRQIFQVNPRRLILLDNSEFNLYSVHKELTDFTGNSEESNETLIPLLGSVSDARRMDEVLELFAPDTVFHAAAFKHVPLVEHNALEGIANNVFGTLTIANLAVRHKVANFTLISTDKAVRPTNIMGATKRLAEMVLQALSQSESETSFSMVRFGNVLGSSGSVVPLFRDQIAAGGPITITHPEMTRYFMTIPEAAQLVVQAGAMAEGGDVFLLDMGEPVKIVDLARNMIELSGLALREDERSQEGIALQFVGLRPGEKLYEELLIGEKPLPTEHPRIMRSIEDFLPWEDLNSALTSLRQAMDEGDAFSAKEQIKLLVPEYQSSSPLVDWTGVVKQQRQASPHGASGTVTPITSAQGKS